MRPNSCVKTFGRPVEKYKTNSRRHANISLDVVDFSLANENVELFNAAENCDIRHLPRHQNGNRRHVRVRGRFLQRLLLLPQ
jgi:hypothetical protein